jgi:hypothetical protein
MGKGVKRKGSQSNEKEIDYNQVDIQEETPTRWKCEV